MTDTLPQFADQVAAQLRKYSYRYNDERELQDQLQAGPLSGLVFHREYELSPEHRIDFWLPHGAIGLGLEVKVGGSPAGVLRQVHGYAQHAEVGELILVTSRIRLGQLFPEQLNGKRVQVVALWEGCL